MFSIFPKRTGQKLRSGSIIRQMGNLFLEQAKNVASHWRVLSPGDKIIKPKLAKQDKDDSAKDRYDVILVIDLLTGLELNKKNSRHVIEAGGGPSEVSKVLTIDLRT